jgi:serine protease Do
MRKLIAALALLTVLIAATACHIEITTTGPGQVNNPDITPTPAPATTPASTAANITPVDPAWKAPTADASAAVLPNMADVVDKCNPSVVTITTEQIANDMFSRQVLQSGAGSGWVLDKKGIIVTNNHVVEGANKVVLQFADGRTYEGNPSNVFRDPTTDLAIIKVNLEGLTQLSVGDSAKLRVGEWVLALGNPLGKGIKAKEGIISGVKVSLSTNEEDALYDLIETSAAINPGNSGGPLLNMKGEVIGITSAKISSVGVEGMGYAISINSALPILQELITKGYVIRPFLGVELYTNNEYVASYNRLGTSKGAVVVTVQPGSPSAIAGLRKLDVITKYKGQDINNAPELLKALRSSQIGEDVSITFMRVNTVHTVTATLVTSPPPK